MTRYALAALLACLVAGCTTPQDSGTATASSDTPKPKRIHCDPPTGSHIIDPNNCAGDPFVKRSVITDRSGNPLETQGNPVQ